jgi:hypothetical protein
MKKYIIVLFCSFFIFSSVVAQHSSKLFSIKHPDQNKNINIGYLEHLPDDYAQNNNQYPLIIFLHGAEDIGNGGTDLYKVASKGLPKLIQDQSFPKSFTVNGETHKFIVISPQLNPEYSGTYWSRDYIGAVFSYVKKNYRVDPSRVYLTGLSLGGGGVWEYSSSTKSIADSLAAIAPVCGAASSNSHFANIIATSRLPVWAFHGILDETVTVQTTSTWVNLINSNLINPIAKATLYPNVGHNSWDYAYDLNYNQNNAFSNENLYSWLLQNQRLSLVPEIVDPELPTQTANDKVTPYTENFMYGSNMGYYTASRTDYDLASLVKNIGGHTIRPSLPQSFLSQYGYDIRLSTFRDYQEKLNMREITAFLEGPSEAVRDKNKYDGSTQESRVFKNLYEPVWNTDGSVNPNNYYADYVYQTIRRYGPYVKFWEIWNEPDFTTSLANLDEWVFRAPKAYELQNLQAPLYYYIRMLRISYEIIKKYTPDAYIATGGIGYTTFLDALLRYSDNPDEGKITPEYPNAGGAYFDVLSFHYYPNYTIRSWDNTISDFRYSRYSDRAANRVMEEKDKFETILTEYGYNNITYPKKIFIMTETGVARKTFEYRYGSDEMQKNFVVKTLVQSQKNNIKQVYFYTLGEMANLNDNTNLDEFKLMGFYENLLRDQPGNEKLTQAGIAHKTTSSLLFGYNFDFTKTQNLNLSNTVDGAAFVKDNDTKYILWAKTHTDRSETAQASYSFPSSLNITTLYKYEWDFSSTNTFETINSNTISLTGSPSIFTFKSEPNPNPEPEEPEEPEEPQQPEDYKSEYTIYPNPSPGYTNLRVKSKKTGNGTFLIYATNGEKIKEGSFVKNAETIDIDLNLDYYIPGIYLVKIIIENEVKVLKMIKSSSVLIE